MRKETISYEDYNGVKRTEDFYFGFSKAELHEMNFMTPGANLGDKLKKLVDSPDSEKMTAFFKKFILNSYGEKSEDGRRFIKSEELSKAFEETPAYSELWMKLFSDQKYALEFFLDVVPQDIKKEYLAQEGNNIVSLPG